MRSGWVSARLLRVLTFLRGHCGDAAWALRGRCVGRVLRLGRVDGPDSIVAVAIYVYGNKAGYIPRDEAKRVARLLDAGYSAEFTAISASFHYGKKRLKDEWGDSYYDYDFDNTIPMAYVTLVCEKPELAPAARRSKQETGKHVGSKDRNGKKTIDGTYYVGVADFIVRSHGYSCKHRGHTMTPVEASVAVLIADSILDERTFRAFYCEQCGKYFVTDTAFERLTRGGRLCCRVIELQDAINLKEGKGRFSQYAKESMIHQYGYNVAKAEGLTSGNRQSILSFVIENDIMSQYEIISFLEGLIRTREGMRNMQDAVAKWKEDVRFLERYKPPERSLKVGKMYAKRR